MSLVGFVAGRTLTLLNDRLGSKSEELTMSTCLPLCPRTRTLPDAVGTSDLCHKRSFILACLARPACPCETSHPRRMALHRAGQAYGERLHRKLQGQCGPGFLSRSGAMQFYVHRIKAADEFGIFRYRMGSSNQVALHLVARFSG